jgi:cytochrome c5
MTPVIKFVRPLSAFGFAALAVLSSCEKVDDGAATRAHGWDGTLSTVIEPGPREVFTDIEETMPAASPCEKTAADAHEILKKNCSVCHDIGAASSGVPRFDFVMNDDQLKAKTWERMGQPALRFLIPGDPDNSVIYERAAVARDMPPIQGDVNAPFYPRVTYSEASVLREWILNCFEGGAVAAPSTGSAGGG